MHRYAITYIVYGKERTRYRVGRSESAIRTEFERGMTLSGYRIPASIVSIVRVCQHD